MTLEQFAQMKIVDPEKLTAWADAQRALGRSIATTNGCFDLLHRGHLHQLFEASRQADRLIVALNSDLYIQKYKGAFRPFQALPERLIIMASLSYVDAVTWFEETTCLRFLRAVSPDVHVNGAEYGPDCAEANTLRELGARLHLIDRLGEYSTTNLVRKLREGL